MSNQRPQQVAIPGILGGLGPLAHIEFERCLLAENSKRGIVQDQAHPVWLLINATSIPDRTTSWLNQDDSCLQALIKYTRWLEKMGADFLVIPCHTSHIFYSSVQPKLKIPWLNLISLTTEFLTQNFPQLQRVGILATTGTIASGIYQKSLKETGFTPIYFPPDSSLQNLVMQSIYNQDWGIKATGDRISEQVKTNLHYLSEILAKEKAEIIIAGCTELSVGFRSLAQSPTKPWLDPLEILAQQTLDIAFGLKSLKNIIKN